MRKYWFARGLKFVGFAAVAIAVGSAVVMWLWNWVMPATFGLPALTLGKAFALLALSRILLGGFHGGMGRRVHWRRRMRERFEQMSTEQRDQFMKGMGGRCGHVEPQVPEQTASSA